MACARTFPEMQFSIQVDAGGNPLCGRARRHPHSAGGRRHWTVSTRPMVCRPGGLAALRHLRMMSPMRFVYPPMFTPTPTPPLADTFQIIHAGLKLLGFPKDWPI